MIDGRIFLVNFFFYSSNSQLTSFFFLFLNLFPTTTGPLGQGICNAVGLAAAEAHMAARFNKPDAKVVDHYTYCIMGDGECSGKRGEKERRKKSPKKK